MWANACWLLVVVLLQGCSIVPALMFEDDSEYEANKAAAIAAAVQLNPDSQQDEFVGETITVYLSDFKFEPRQITLESGTVVRIRLRNVAWVTHYFGGEEFFAKGAEIINILGSKIPAHQHHVPASPHIARDLYLYVKEPGDYPLNCFVPNHRLAGMKGILKVVESGGN